VASGLLCVALDPGPGQWLHLLAQDLLIRPPPFPWRMALGPRCAECFGVEFDEHCLTRALGDSLSLSESVSLMESKNWRAGGVLLAAAGLPAELALLTAARHRQLRTGQYVETWYGYRRRLLPSAEWPAPDHLLLPDSVALSEAATEGVSATRVHIVGNPVWDGILSDKGGDVGQWLFIDAPVRRDYADTLGYTEDASWSLVAAEHQRRDVKLPILFAPHPTDLKKTIPAGAVAVRYHLSLLNRVDTVFGMFSAPLIDAYLRGRRVISVQPNLQYDINPLSRRGLIPLVTDAETLSAALDDGCRSIDSEFQQGLKGSLGRLRMVAEEIMRV